MSTIFKRPKLPNFDLMTVEDIRRYTDQFEGVFFAVPLDGQYCFGRVLRRPITACYDLPPSGIRPIDEIEQAPVLISYDGRHQRCSGRAAMEDSREGASAWGAGGAVKILPRDLPLRSYRCL